jgi:hypothetical protein
MTTIPDHLYGHDDPTPIPQFADLNLKIEFFEQPLGGRLVTHLTI